MSTILISIFRYLGISGIGNIPNTEGIHERAFNAVSWLAYWDVYKNYYANKQEEKGYTISGGSPDAVTANSAFILAGSDGTTQTNILNTVANNYATHPDDRIIIDLNAAVADPYEYPLEINGVQYDLRQLFKSVTVNSVFDITCALPTSLWLGFSGSDITLIGGVYTSLAESGGITLESFDLNKIDTMREDILAAPDDVPFKVDDVVRVGSTDPYGITNFTVGSEGNEHAITQSQVGLGIKTYQSDLFNNWINTDWIDGPGGINDISKVSTASGGFEIDALNLAMKVYKLLNRIAISGGSYDDWLNATYTHERSRGIEEPVYHGSLIKELAFQEVVSNSFASAGEIGAGLVQPLGTLGGRGRLTSKNKGGDIKIKTDEPCVLLGIVSLTPRVDYSQGNTWHMNLKNWDELHKPELDAIGYQDLLTDQMRYQETTVFGDGSLAFTTAGKVPAWINYMTDVNKCFGDFADEDKAMFMTLNRRYTVNDITTYIDPTKYNQIFADTNLDAQNFWVQISNQITGRRKMSAKVIPNL